MNEDPGLRRLENALLHLDEEKRPRDDWQERVLAATKAPRRPFLARPSIMALAAAAAVVLVWLLLPDRPPGSPALELAVATQPAETRTRGASATPGDTLEAKMVGGPHRALWIYHDDELVLACPGGSMCLESEHALRAILLLPAGGTYSVVALSSKAPIPPPEGALDHDVAAALSHGAEHKTKRKIVR